MLTRTQAKRGSGCDPPEAVDALYDRDRIVAGIEFDRYGRRIAYHILRDSSGPSASAFQRRDMVHVFRADAPGQVRGVSWFAPVILKLHEYDKASDALGMRLQIAAMLCGFVTNRERGVPQFARGRGGRHGGIARGGLEPGTLKTLAAGEDIAGHGPARPWGREHPVPHVTASEIASGLGLPYEALSGDLSQVNYSSIRAGLSSGGGAVRRFSTA